MLKKPLSRLFSLLIIIYSLNSLALERKQIRIVGSSTLYPFITILAERFGKISENYTPVVEATGTGGGFQLFCSGNSLKYPDMVNASRKIKKSELDFCYKNGVNNIYEYLIGHDGIVLAQSSAGKNINLSIDTLFLAIAKYVPIDGNLVNNPFNRWNEIDPSLPNNKIEIYGPSYVSGTRDVIIELILNKYCEDSSEIQEIVKNDPDKKYLCSLIREDGNYIEMPENYNLLIQKITSNKNALSILSDSLLEENIGIKTIKINNIQPSKKSISNGSYPLARSLYIYLNRSHIKDLTSLEDFINFIASKTEKEYLETKGLITD